MKTPLILFALLFAVCSPPPPPKTYTKPEVGMPYMSEFFLLCPYSYVAKTVTTEKGKMEVVINEATDYTGGTPRTPECTGTFVFINDHLDSIAR